MVTPDPVFIAAVLVVVLSPALMLMAPLLLLVMLALSVTPFCPAKDTPAVEVIFFAAVVKIDPVVERLAAPVMLVVPDSVKSLLMPVIVALRLPVPLMSFESCVVAARTKFKFELFDSVTAPVPIRPVVLAAPTCNVPPLMVVVPL